MSVKVLKESNEQGYSVKQISLDVAIKGDKIDGLGGGSGSNKFFNAMCNFLESQGMRMAGDMIDEHDMTDTYDGIYEDDGGIASLFEE